MRNFRSKRADTGVSKRGRDEDVESSDCGGDDPWCTDSASEAPRAPKASDSTSDSSSSSCDSSSSFGSE